jgi:hypothetical protein
MRLCEIVSLVGYALGGLAGERLLNRLGIKSSYDTGVTPGQGAKTWGDPAGSACAER